MISPNDPDFEEGGDCRLREHVPPPEEEVNGIVFRYFNNPVLFIQEHVPDFIEEKWYREKHGQMPEYRSADLRWLRACKYFDGLVSRYQARAERMAIAQMQRGRNVPED
jgi:hypothetical protein